MRLGDLETALKHYTRALNQNLSNRDRLTALTLRGDLLRKKRRYDSALEDFNRALSLCEKHGDPQEKAALYVRRGQTYRAQGEYVRAISDYNLALQINPYMADAYFHRGNAYRLRRMLKMALSDLNQAINIEPNHHFYYYRSGVLVQLKRLPEAVADMEEAVRQRPGRAAYKARLNYLKSQLED
jgi:tetratricopeptide (TPR) repeat protein